MLTFGKGATSLTAGHPRSFSQKSPALAAPAFWGFCPCLCAYVDLCHPQRHLCRGHCNHFLCIKRTRLGFFLGSLVYCLLPVENTLLSHISPVHESRAVPRMQIGTDTQLTKYSGRRKKGEEAVKDSVTWRWQSRLGYHSALSGEGCEKMMKRCLSASK